ncbi:MAG: pyridoxal phosphate-dependent aminotransferase [Chloroflexi bacterium]|nr:MAG: pyridoxal phosphate-dependent aminotransferase [Chloroflexota bacterium]HDN79463.1 pyridoxal phosphate-dependent aminotransferase [Chloroflexota bacterium]
MKTAKRMARLGTETAFEVLAKARALEAQGRDIIHLEIGEPDFDTPRNIIDAAIKALNDGYTHYTPSAGFIQLRQTIAEYISKTRNIDVGPENVVVVPGGKPIIFFSILALCEEGDEVIYPNPGYPIYESMINFVGATPVPIRLRMEKNFSFDIDEFRSLISPRTKMIVINSPQNPTGGILTREDLEAIAEVAIENDIMVLSDEIYSRIIYDGEFQSIASLPGMKEHTILLDGFSKTYAMTGWRLGYGVMPEWLAEHITRLMTNSNSCAAAFTQIAGIEALTGPQDEVDKMVQAFRERRDLIVERLNKIPGFKCLKPSGAFYVFPNIEGTGMKSKEMADYLLYEGGVAVLPGTSFGEYGEGFIRLSYANSLENISKALDRIEEVISRL